MFELDFNVTCNESVLHFHFDTASDFLAAMENNPSDIEDGMISDIRYNSTHVSDFLTAWHLYDWMCSDECDWFK